MNTPRTILVIEDEPEIRRFLRISLCTDGHFVIEAATANEGQALFVSNTIDLVLLDLGLPDMDGLSVINWIREFSMTPIIVLSARSSADDKVTALDAGANDYLVKPFTIPNLKARIDAVIRNPQELLHSGIFTTGYLKVDLDHERVETAENDQVILSPLEFRILRFLVDNAGQIVTHTRILKEIWGSNQKRSHLDLRLVISRLRQKIEREPSRPVYLLSESGVGYRLQVLNPSELER